MNSHRYLVMLEVLKMQSDVDAYRALVQAFLPASETMKSPLKVTDEAPEKSFPLEDSKVVM